MAVITENVLKHVFCQLHATTFFVITIIISAAVVPIYCRTRTGTVRER